MAGKTNVPATQPQGGAIAAYDYGEYAGMGMDKVGKDELLIPFLSILQPMTPVVVDGEIPGIKAGLFYNSITGDMYEGDGAGVPFQLVDFERMFVEWVPREKGGGIAGRYTPDDPFVKSEIAKNDNSVVGITLDNGNELIETYYAYGNILSADFSQVEGFAVLPLKSTHIKPFRTLLTALRMIKGKPPLFAFKVVLKCTKEKNDKGTWYQLTARPSGADWRGSMIDPGTERHLLEAATSLLDMVRSGAAKADFENEGKATGGDGSGGGSGRGSDSDDDVPF